MPIIRSTYSLNQSPLYKLRNKKRLAELLGISPSDLKKLSKNADSLYREFPIEKKNGGFRDVENPSRALKLVQARLARWLSRISPPDYLFCPVKGRCYVSNAAQHLGHRVVRCLDIRKYFPSTSSKRVYWFFNKIMQCDPDIAAIIARIATYKGHLPTGSPLSPIMSYFAHYDVWQTISSICNEHGYKLTVYIDDVTISAPKLSVDVIWKIKSAIHRSGLRYHKEKRYVDAPAEITGVILKDGSLVVPNRQLKKRKEIRQQILQTPQREDVAKLQNRLTGIEGQIAQITARSLAKS